MYSAVDYRYEVKDYSHMIMDGLLVYHYGQLLICRYMIMGNRKYLIIYI